MWISRRGAYRNRGKTTIIRSKPSEIKDLCFKFYNVLGFNNPKSVYDYNLDFSDEELDQLLQEREKRNRRKIRIGSVVLQVLEHGKWNPEAEERLRELLDQNLVRDDDREPFGLEPRRR